jgi:FSR family fosmidomycin resistance protein-like MFS transporter
MIAELRATARAKKATVTAALPARSSIPIGPLLAIIGVMMSRQWTTSSLQAFIPTWYAALGYPPSFYGPLATTLVLASALGAIGAGTIADRFGRRRVIVVSLLATIPPLFLFAQFPGPIAFLSVALVGLSAASTGPLMLVMAQQLMAGRAGVASGLILGLGFVTGAIGIPITGAIADALGFGTAMKVQVLVVVLSLAIASFLPSEERFRRDRDKSAAAS